MSKSLLEQLLIQAETLNEETEELVDKNQKTILESTMADAVLSFIQEAVNEADADTEEETENMSDEPEYSEEDVDAETGETVEDSDEEMEDSDEEFEIDNEEDMEGSDEEFSDDDEIEIEDDSEEFDMDSDEEMGDDEGFDMEDEFEGEEETVDLTQASLEEVMEFIENADDNTVFQVVKTPTYSIKTDGSEGASDEADLGASMDDDTEIEIDEDVLMEVLADELSEVEQMKVYNSNEIESALKNKEPGEEIGIKTNAGVKVVQENKKLKAQLDKVLKENKELKLNETKAVAALKKMIKQAEGLALVNSNLAYVSRLFTEHATTKQEKIEILKRFDSVQTIDESQKTFKTLNESFSKKTQKKTIKVDVKESVEMGQQKVIKEETAYVDPTQEKILRLMNFKSTL